MRGFVLLSVLIVLCHGLTHPGVLISQSQLDYVKSQVSAKASPEYSAYQKAESADIGSKSYKKKGPPSNNEIECGEKSEPDHGCSDDDSDSSAAYLQAVLWYITGDDDYLNNAIDLLNAYSKVEKFTDSNAPLQAAWSASKWSRAAELVKHTSTKWSSSDASAFQKVLHKVHLPLIQDGSTNNGNWELSMIEGLLGIAVFSDNETLFNHGVTMWKQRVPAYFYYEPVDGDKHQAAPRGSPSWYGQETFNKSVDGLCQETCRDFGHSQYGLAATLNAASTASIQGTDLFGAEQPRLAAALEFHAKYLNGAKVPHYVCDGKGVTLIQYPTFELGYNYYHNKVGVSLPETEELITNVIRKMSYLSDGHMSVWETLTHSGNPSK